jgi:flagellar protein FliS
VTFSASQNYQTQQIMTASPARLVVLLHEKAISLLGEAAAAAERNDVGARHKANRKAIDIIAHLWSTLDLERGGEIAANLNRIYGYMMGRLAEVDMRNDAQAAREVMELLEPLRRSWRELAEGEARPETTAPAAEMPGGPELPAGGFSLSA